ncbi:hypothetical protein P8C59_005123 [Phyllachora maydis]|uniref:DSBA-like thioredoxin domain-containing protein n=1 Tax=Phyllachora maydis TaxID=1825666 RepID=A0AAD9I420_9PEZI|nr:hypothetical protein P8C59_005123 [Phyllachora maydis]
MRKMGGRIELYLDITSLYSYVAFLDLRRNRETLRAYNIDVDIRPVFLGAINAGSGNRPPWVLPAKAAYGLYDARRTIARAGHPPVQFPDDLMAVSRTVIPLRALHYIRREYPRETFETTVHYLFHRFWGPESLDLTLRESVVGALAAVPAGFDAAQAQKPARSARLLFTAQEVHVIVRAASSQNMKDALTATTQEALGRGAFGCPWLWVTNAAGESEPFFGSDRFHFVYDFLGLPYNDVTLLSVKDASSQYGKPKLCKYHHRDIPPHQTGRGKVQVEKMCMVSRCLPTRSANR